MRTNKDQRCMMPGCLENASCRGLCMKCYSMANRLVQQGRTTWEQLEKNGKILPKHSQNAKVNWLLEEMPS